MSQEIRAFLSIDVEDDSLLTRIVNIQNRLESDIGRLKMVERQNIHFTLRFFDNISNVIAERMYQALAQIEFHPFTIKLEGVGAFPSPRRPNVIWIGVSDGREQIVTLKKEIDNRLTTIGFKPEGKFAVHATIARVKFIQNTDKLMKILESLSKEHVGTMTVNCFRLTQSTLTPTGPIYKTFWELPTDTRQKQ